jgi:hypothetical protein
VTDIVIMVVMDCITGDEKPWSKLPMHSCVDLWHLPGLYELRQHPNVYSVFAQLYETHKLCVSIDRISVKPTHYVRDLGVLLCVRAPQLMR